MIAEVSSLLGRAALQISWRLLRVIPHRHAFADVTHSSRAGTVVIALQCARCRRIFPLAGGEARDVAPGSPERISELVR